MSISSSFLLVAVSVCCCSVSTAFKDGSAQKQVEQDHSNSPDKLKKNEDLVGQEVEYGKVNGQPVRGYLSLPPDAAAADADKKYPAIILIHEWWGLNDDIRSKADRFARDGYVALAVDLYGKPATADRQEAQKMATAVRDNMDTAFENLKSAVGFLSGHKRVDKSRMASIGWCFGGGWSYQIAKNNLGVKASVIYYGQFNPADDLEKMKAAIMGHFADNDRGISVDDVKQFRAKLKTLGGNHEIFIYPNTTHGFASRKGDNENYVAEAADLAHKRTMEFLIEALRPEKKQKLALEKDPEQ